MSTGLGQHRSFSLILCSPNIIIRGPCSSCSPLLCCNGEGSCGKCGGLGGGEGGDNLPAHHLDEEIYTEICQNNHAVRYTIVNLRLMQIILDRLNNFRGGFSSLKPSSAQKFSFGLLIVPLNIWYSLIKIDGNLSDNFTFLFVIFYSYVKDRSGFRLLHNLMIIGVNCTGPTLILT